MNETINQIEIYTRYNTLLCAIYDPFNWHVFLWLTTEYPLLAKEHKRDQLLSIIRAVNSSLLFGKEVCNHRCIKLPIPWKKNFPAFRQIIMIMKVKEKLNWRSVVKSIWPSMYKSSKLLKNLKVIKSFLRFVLNWSSLISPTQSKSIFLRHWSLFVISCFPDLLLDLSIKVPRLGCLWLM